MDRRQFIKSTLLALKSAALMHMLGIPIVRAAAPDMTGNMKQAYNLSMREIAGRKLHHGPERYLNPFARREHGGFWRVMRWKLFAENRFKGFYEQEPVAPVKIDWKQIEQHHDLAVTFLKHATLIIKDGDEYIYVDPVFFKIFRFIKDFTPIDFDIKSLPKPDHILITHGHYDHLDKKSLAFFDKQTHVITPLGYDSIFKDLDMGRRDRLDWFDTAVQNGREITCLPCHHWTMRNPITGPNTSLWGSYLIKTRSGPVIYVSGDLAYFDRFSELGKEFQIDLAIFNLGAYEPRWFMADSHINPAETVRAFQEINAKKLMIAHWGTFRLGDEPIHFPPIDILREVQKAGLQDHFIPITHGQTLFYDSLKVL